MRDLGEIVQEIVEQARLARHWAQVWGKIDPNGRHAKEWRELADAFEAAEGALRRVTESKQ